MDEKLDSELMALFDKLVASEARVDLIAQIDFQLKSYKENPELYILPNACRWMTAALENFGEEPESWLRFIRRIRREFPKRSRASTALATVYRKVDSRVDAQIRRARIAKAVEACANAHGHFADGKEEKEYARRLQLYWRLGRENRKAAYRRAQGADKLSYEEQSDVYDAHWDEINAQIAQGTVPTMVELVQNIKDAQHLNRLYYGEKPLNQEAP